jgi:hypothetical protein
MIATTWCTNGKECWQIVDCLPYPENISTREEMREKWNEPCFTEMLDNLPVHFADELYPNDISKINKEHRGMKYYTLEWKI